MSKKRFIQSEPEPTVVKETLTIKPKFQIGDIVWFLSKDTLKAVSKEVASISTISTGHGWDQPTTQILYSVVNEGDLESYYKSSRQEVEEQYLFATKEELINSL